MGFLFASLRQFNVVMAPDFMSIVYVNLNFILRNNSKYTQQYLFTDSFKYYDLKFYHRLMCVKIIKYEINLTGVHVSLCEVINHIPVKIYDCFTIVISNIVKYYIVIFDYESQTVYKHCCCIMNSSDPSMGDSAENMGLQKIDMRSFENNYVKEKNFVQEYSGVSNFSSDITTNGDFMHIEEDIMSVLKNISTDFVEKEPNLFNAQNSMVDVANSEQIFSIADNADISGSLSTFEQDLLNQVDAIEMVNEISVNVPSSNEETYKDKHSAAKERIRHFERRIQRLCRRLRMKQSRLLNAHVKDEVHSLLDHEQNSWYLPEISADLDGDGGLDTTDVKGSLKLHAKNLEEVFDSDATASSSGNDSVDEESSIPTNPDEDRILKIPLKKRVVWKWLHERAGATYRIAWLQSHILDLEYKIHQYTELYKRVRHSKSKVQLSSRSRYDLTQSNGSVHTRLGAANLVVNGYHGSLFPNPEMFFNNNNNNNNSNSEISNNRNGNSGINSNNNIVNNKTGIEDSGSDSSNEHCETSRTKCLLKSRFEKRKLIKLEERLLPPTVSTSSSSLSSYKVPFAIATKTSVHCSCTWPLTCVLCINRDNIDSAAISIASTSNMAVKNSLVDPAYHPVLSQQSNASLSVHLSALLKKPEFHEKFVEQISGNGGLYGMQSQQSMKSSLYANSKRIPIPSTSTEEMNKMRMLDSSGSGNLTNGYKKRKYTRRINNTVQDSTSVAGGINKGRNPKLGELNNASYRKYKRKKRKLFKLSDSDLEDDFANVDDSPLKKEDTYSSQPNSPYSTHSNSASKDSHRRKREQPFDIDNFVIPPNTTQQPVIVKPKYKEILIPRWTVVKEEDDKNINRSTVPKVILEDLDLEIVILHEKLEVQEKSKFRTPSHQDKSTGQNGRGRKRTDSCPEIGEINGNTTGRTTPVLPSDGVIGTVIASSSANTTPVLFRSNLFEYNSPDNNIPTSSSRRNRTTSLSRGKMISSEYENAESPSQLDIAPFEPRSFPLTDEEVENMMRYKDTHRNSFSSMNCVGDSSQKPAFKDEQSSSRLQSPTSESTESILEDSNDNEWMREFLLKEQILESMK